MPLVAIVCLLVMMALFPTLRCTVLHPFKAVFYGAVDLYHYIVRKKWHEAKYGRIICYVANSSTSFGCGKTLTATDYLVNLYHKYNGKKIWCMRRKAFVTQQIKIISNVEFLTIPYERLVSLSQFVAWTDKAQQYDDEHGTLSVTYLLIDEASSQMNSRAFKSNFDPYFISRLLTSRHVCASLYLTSQRPGMVDKLMRDCCNMYVGCKKVWRFQCMSYYDAYEMENSQNPALVAPLRKTCWFICDKAFRNYDTFASVQALKKSCEAGDMLSEQEILALQCGPDTNMEGVVKPSRKFLNRMKKERK